MTAARVLGDVITVVRAVDQLLVSVILEDLELVEAGLTPTGDGPGFLTVVVPPQHTVESIPAADPVPVGPYANRVSGPSRLRFEIAAGTVIPFTVEGLLGWTDRTLVLDPRATTSGGPFPTTEPTTTYVEMPQGLYLSPGRAGRFVTLAQPRTFGAITELWRLRLGREQTVDDTPVVVEPPDTTVGVRAIWTDDHEPTVPADDWTTTPADEFPRLPTHLDQRHLVRAMGDHDMDEEYPNHEAAVATRLWLSLSGGWFAGSGTFSGSGVLAAWEQRVATGRDVHVRVAHRGWITPFGHVASVIEIADRTFLVDADGEVTAALRQREFLAVSPNTVDIATLAPAMAHAGRELPFGRIDLVSNFIVEIGQAVIPGVADDSAVFLPTDLSDGSPVLFDYAATDRTGVQQASFGLPGVFIRADAEPPDIAAVIDHYAGTDSADLRSTDLRGQPVAYADEPPGTEGDGKTTLPTFAMSFTLAEPTATLPDGIAALVPAMETAAVVDAKVDTLRGQDAEPFTVKLATEWLEDALDLDVNVALGFLDLDVPITLPFSGGGSGIAAPELTVQQLTALLGPAIKLAGVDEWDPAVALGGDQALFLGAVRLDELIDKINIGGDVLAERGLPSYDIELRRPDPEALPDELCISLTWNPPLRSFGDTLLVAQDPDIDDSPFPADAQGELDFLLKTCIPLDDLEAEPQNTVDVTVRNIMIQLPPPNPIIAVAFTKIRFLDPPDGPADVDVEIAAVRFLGALTFLEPIQEFLAGLGGGPRLDIRDDAIQADLTFPLPDISLGVLGITGLEIGTGLVIDLTGGPLRAAFNLGTRSDPFTLTVMGFGGSGSLELEASPHPVGIVRLELSLAFVLELSVDVVVAKGSLRASFGASLEVTATLVDGEVSADVTLGAFLDILGEVEVLGIISIVVQVLLTLEYTASTGLLVGEATVTASVDVAFIEKEVSFTISQEMALGDGSAARTAMTAAATSLEAAGGFVTRFPTKQLWAGYCAAFADEKGIAS